MRAWRTSIGFLVETDRSDAPILSSQLDALPDPRWRALLNFVLLDEFGIVLRRYDALAWSLEDELGMTVHAVIEASFRSLTVIQHTGSVQRTTRDEETLLSDLKPVAADELETLELIEEGLKSDRNLSLQRMQDRIREAERILPKEPPTPDDDPEYLRVAGLVRGRVEAFAREPDKMLLRTLAKFGELRRSLAASAGALPAFQPALALFLLACRRCCFDPTLEPEAQRPPAITGRFEGVSDADRNALETLAGMLGALEREILLHAEIQDDVDAHLNAAEYRAAANHVARSRERLTAGLAR